MRSRAGRSHGSACRRRKNQSSWSLGFLPARVGRIRGQVEVTNNGTVPVAGVIRTRVNGTAIGTTSAENVLPCCGTHHMPLWTDATYVAPSAGTVTVEIQYEAQRSDSSPVLVVEGSQYATPLGLKYAPIARYKEEYRGVMTFWKFDRKAGRITPERSFAVEIPPYWQDLADAGKGTSDGWVFQNSFNTEMATGGIEKGNPPFEAGASQRDMDYLHILNYRNAEASLAAGRYTYEVRARWTQDGRTVTQAQRVAVSPGAHVTVDFPSQSRTD